MSKLRVSSKLIATLRALFLRFASSRAIVDDAVTLAFGARRHRCSPPAGVAIEFAGGISHAVDNNPTMWLKPSRKIVVSGQYKPVFLQSLTTAYLERVMDSGKQTCPMMARASFPRTRESSPCPRYWIPACAGMTFPCGLDGLSISIAEPSTCITRSRRHAARLCRGSCD
jgi:hypothetical protein